MTQSLHCKTVRIHLVVAVENIPPFHPPIQPSAAVASPHTMHASLSSSSSISIQPTPPKPSSPHQPIQQRPSQHKTTQPPKHVGSPQAGELRLEIPRRPPLGQEEVDEGGDEQRAEQVEEEAGVGLEAEDAGCDAE